MTLPWAKRWLKDVEPSFRFSWMKVPGGVREDAARERETIDEPADVVGREGSPLDRHGKLLVSSPTTRGRRDAGWAPGQTGVGRQEQGYNPLGFPRQFLLVLLNETAQVLRSVRSLSLARRRSSETESLHGEM
jgi:hypothetical protein